MALHMAINSEPQVRPEWACPKCGERRMDALICDPEDGETVKCFMCGTVFKPPLGVIDEESTNPDAAKEE